MRNCTLTKSMRNIGILFCLSIFVVILTGMGMTVSANAQEEPTSVVTFTSSTTVMKVDEQFQFAALITNEDGTTSTIVTWSSSNVDVIYISNDAEEGIGLAIALGEGNATITATAADGAFASVDVYVSDSAIHVESIELYPDVLELGVGWKTRIRYTILPGNASDHRVAFASSDSSVITVDENGNVEALTAGTAIITATTYDGGIVATCDVVVYEELEEATLTPNPLVTTIGQETNNNLTVIFPEGVSSAGATYRWYSAVDRVASIGCCPPWCHCGHCGYDGGATAFISSWNFGTTSIYVVATTADGAKYAAMATVHVTSTYFYLTGLEEDLADPTDPGVTPWVTYDTAEEAQAAGVLLVPDANNPLVFSLTRSLWALDDFQIIHSGIQTGWATKITPRAFVEDGSSMAYIANNADTFAVNALGTYTVTLDLSDGPAKVSIVMDSLKVTSLDLSVASENAYLQYDASAEEGTEVVTRKMLLDVYTIPEAATYALADVSATVPEDMAEYVTATPVMNDGKLQIELTLLKAVEANTAFQLTVEINNQIDKLSNAIDDITITILADGAEYVPVTSIAFTSDLYTVNVNNGAKPWNAPIKAIVNEGASVEGIMYSEDSDHLYIEYIDGEPYIHADAIGVYTIYANALGNPNLEPATAMVLVTSLVEPTVTGEDSGFYLIGRLDGVEVNNWMSILPEETDYTSGEAKLFADWVLTVDGFTYDEKGNLASAIYSGTFNFRANDVFSIAFLGMNGNWWGVIDNQYMNWDSSTGTYWYNNINIEFAENGRYVITLTIDANGPSFTIERIGSYTPNTEYDLWLYIVRSCCSWNPALTPEGNTLVTVGFIHINNGVAESMTLTSEGFDFYEFYSTTNEWPDIQFVTAYTLDGTGLEGGYFQNATWYGSTFTGITFDGTAYRATGEENHFTNYEGRSELYWVGQGEYRDQIPTDMAGQMTVVFTFTFDEGGTLTGIGLNFISPTIQ